MGLISVDKVTPGMVLADKVITSKSMVLLPAGATLTEKHLITFKTWGISEVNISGQGENQVEDITLSPEELKALKEKIAEIFIFNNTSKQFTRALFDIACNYPGKSS